MKTSLWQLKAQIWARFGSRAWSWSGSGFQSLSGSGARSLSWSWSGFGGNSRFGNWKWSLIENYQFLASQTQDVSLKLTSISELNPRVFISKQKQVGFKLRGNQLEVGQEFENISSKIIKAGIPILALKEVEIAVEKIKRKMRFCLIGEELWLVFR